MDISAVNYNAVNRGAASSSSDGTDGPVNTSAKADRLKSAVALESQLSLIPPAKGPEEIASESVDLKRQPKRGVNVTV